MSAGETIATTPTRSRDATEVVVDQLKRRPSVGIAASLLALLYAVAIFAPLLANDRPLFFEGTDRDGYRRAQRQVGGVSAGLLERARQGRGAYAAEHAGDGPELPGYDDALRSEHGALALRAAILRRQLDADAREPLAALSRAADEVLARALGSDTRPDPALEDAGAALLAAADRVRAELTAVEPGAEPEPGRTVVLRPARSYPALEGLSAAEVYFMALWLLVLGWPLWNPLVDRWWLAGDQQARRRARRPKLVAVVLLPLVVTGLWVALGPQAAPSLAPLDAKAGVDRGAVQPVRLALPPLPFGMAEQNLTESLRPPTWHASSGMDEEGYYLSGPYSRRVDEATGFPIRREPVEVRSGEPPLNAPLRHALGTDTLGRDLLSRLVWGARISLSVGLVSTLLLVLIGTFLGAVAGYNGGWVDVLISRVIEVFQCFPVFFLILIVVAFVGPSVLNIMLAIGLFRWTGVARLVRGEFMRLRNEEFVVASRALGVRGTRTIFRHVLPNAMGPVLVAATFQVAAGILTESALSFLGFGVKLPIPSWGSLLTESRLAEHWWIQVFPGLLIFVTVMLYNLLGEGVRDALDPRLKEA